MATDGAPLPVSFDAAPGEPEAAKPAATTYCCGRCRSSTFCCGRYSCTPRRKACCVAAVVLLAAGAVVAIVCGVYFGLFANRVSLSVGALSGSPLSFAGRRRLLQTPALRPSSAQASSTASAYAQARSPARDRARCAARSRALCPHAQPLVGTNVDRA